MQDYGTVTGGWSNTASGYASAVGGGARNTASDFYSVVSCGYNNSANGDYSVVPGGRENIAAGDFSLAAGRRAEVGPTHHGTFLWADHQDADFYSNYEDEFAVRARNGLRTVSDNTIYGMHVTNNGDGDGLRVTGRVSRGNTYGAVYAYNVGTSPAISALSSGGPAAYLDGDVTVTGNLSVSGTKSFRIDHPLDPDNKWLTHFCVESDEVINVYSGTVVLAEGGAAAVELPTWFEALNDDFRYQLTCIGGWAPVYVAQEVEGNVFRIGGGEPGMKVSWQITGIRQDSAASGARGRVQTVKTEEERAQATDPGATGKAAAATRQGAE